MDSLKEGLISKQMINLKDDYYIFTFSGEVRSVKDNIPIQPKN